MQISAGLRIQRLKLMMNHTLALRVKHVLLQMRFASKCWSNLHGLLLTLLLRVFVLAALCGTLGKAALSLRLMLLLALVLGNACGAYEIFTSTRFTDTNTVTMEPLLATNTADHEPEKSEAAEVVRK